MRALAIDHTGIWQEARSSGELEQRSEISMRIGYWKLSSARVVRARRRKRQRSRGLSLLTETFLPPDHCYFSGQKAGSHPCGFDNPFASTLTRLLWKKRCTADVCLGWPKRLRFPWFCSAQRLRSPNRIAATGAQHAAFGSGITLQRLWVG